MDRRKDEINLAGLLDGELRDAVQVETLEQLVESDALLRAELDEQALVKGLLGELEEYHAPDFMATRVLGEIAARRQAQPRWRPVLTWASGAAALLLGFGTTIGLMAPRAVQTVSPMLADTAGAGSRPVAATLAADSASWTAPGAFLQMQYAEPAWQELELPAGNTDDRIKGFLQFANEAHAYRKQMRGGNATTSSMTDAVLVMDAGQDLPLHWASDD